MTEITGTNAPKYSTNPDINTELLFVNLQKSEEDFSPTTMYNDYAVDASQFHWQSQSTVSESSATGQSYLNQKELQKKIMLFIREAKSDEYGNTAGYVFVGPVNFVKSEGSKPMSILWNLETPLPDFLWTASAKMATA